MKKTKTIKVKAWAVCDIDGDIPDLNYPRIGDFYHINTNKKDAVDFIRDMKKDFPDCGFSVVPCQIIYKRT